MEVTPKTPSTLITTSVTQVGVSVNGESRKPMQVQFNDDGTGLYILGYEMLFSGMDKMFSDSGNLISREDYGKGYTLYTLDLTRQTLPAWNTSILYKRGTFALVSNLLKPCQIQ